MRNFLTIFKYELLMHFKSIRFKGVCVVSILFAIVFYTSGLRMQELRPHSDIFNNDNLFLYFGVFILTGLFSIERIKSTGMHTILFNRPFATFNLMLGQVMAALVSLFLPILIVYFPAGLLLRFQYQVEYPIPPLCYVLLFSLIPMMFSVLCLTTWVRTCFKNNIMAIIITGMILVGAVILSESRLVQISSRQGRIVNFIPFLSSITFPARRILTTLWGQPQISFFQINDWLHLGANFLYASLFLLLACFHLRRTEPQRKVLENYGQHWYHTPTFLKIACDLKVDPHIKKKTKLFLVVLIIIFMGKIFWPLVKPKIEHSWVAYLFSSKEKSHSETKVEWEKRFNPKYLETEDLVQIQILNVKEVLTSKICSSEILFSVSGEISEKIAPMQLGERVRLGHKIKKILIDGEKISYNDKIRTGLIFFEGKNLQKYADGKPHLLKIESKISGDISQTGQSVIERIVRIRGYYFIKIIKKYPDGNKIFDWSYKEFWPIQISVELDEDEEVLKSPVSPEIKMEKEKKFAFFDFSKKIIGLNSSIHLAKENAFSVVETPGLENTIQFIVYKKNEKIMREILDAASPVFKEFCQIWEIQPENPFVLVMDGNNRNRTNLGPNFTYHFKQIQRNFNIFRQMGNLSNWKKEKYLESLRDMELILLNCILKSHLLGNGLYNENEVMDLFKFSTHFQNTFAGLNNRLTRTNNFKAKQFVPLSKKINIQSVSKIKDINREDLWKQYSYQIGIFQMLYLAMGHDQWMEMVKVLKIEMEQGFFSEEIIQGVVEKSTNESYDWFFDYWFRTGEGYPCYQIESATAEMQTVGFEETTEYHVHTKISNVGTGRMLVPINLRTSQGRENHKVWIDSGETVEWSTITKHLPLELYVDSKGWITSMPYFDEKINGWITTVYKKIEIEPTEN